MECSLRHQREIQLEYLKNPKVIDVLRTNLTCMLTEVARGSGICLLV